MPWHRQPQLDQGSAPDKAEGNTLELTSANPFRRVKPENKARSAPSSPGQSPQNETRPPAHRAHRDTHRPARRTGAPVLLPDGARAGDEGPYSFAPQTLRQPSTSSSSTTQPSHTPGTPLLPSRSSRCYRGHTPSPTPLVSKSKDFDATTLRNPPAYKPRTRKHTNATGIRGPPCMPGRAFTSTSSTTSASQGD